MNAIVDPSGPSLAVVPSNPVPEGARVGYFETADKVRLRYATFAKGPGAPRGTICLVQGRCEFIEKYFETVADFQSRGFAVATFDWRGQGGSQRLIGNPRLGYVRRFDDYWQDLRSFHASVLLPDCPAPYYLVGHSMGGLASLYAGIRDRMMFERIFLSAPMVGLDRQPLSMAGMARLTGTLANLGLGRLPIGRRGDKAQTEQSFAGNPLTSDVRRFTRSSEALKARPDLIIGSPTLRWAASAFAAMAGAATDEFPGAVRIPVLMLAAAQDEIVSTHAIETLGLRMRSGRHLVVPGARHEMFMENDSIRGQVFAAFDAFVTEQST
ncbi:alpha/beta fold hydrolase [Devosia sp. CN2-171]|uniref:alpha/beta fold hydrolase n=1 Tax=Devosia sp. CN2-171 TaxID=3400909 RepID=UPI003BF8A04D